LHHQHWIAAGTRLWTCLKHVLLRPAVITLFTYRNMNQQKTTGVAARTVVFNPGVVAALQATMNDKPAGHSMVPPLVSITGGWL
jgi:hypothetical protein